MHRSDRESGTSILMIAAAMLLIIGIAALVVDLGYLRFDLRADRLASDAAAAAAAAVVDPLAGSDAEDACDVAWDYLLLNLGDAGSPSVNPDCVAFAGSCNPAVAITTTGEAGPYDVLFVHPVPDGHPILGSQTVDPLIDGVACQRFGVQVERRRDFTFAAALGFDAGSTTVRSVSRFGTGVGAGEVVPLLVLEPTGCNAIYTSGQGMLTVASNGASPGFIVVDSDGSEPSSSICGPGKYTIDAQGTIQGWIRALPTSSGIPPAILSYALGGPTGVPAKSFDPIDLVSAATGVDPGDPPDTRFRLYPEPRSISKRITRAPVDWRYNCLPIYPDYLGIPIKPCPFSTPPHIKNLVESDYGDPVGSQPSGFLRWSSSYPCFVRPATWPSLLLEVATADNWWIDCPSGLTISGVKVVIHGGDVVLDGGIDLRSDGILWINKDDTTDRVAYVRNGDIAKVAQAQIVINETFVYLDNGVVDLVGGPAGLEWIAPDDPGGPFEDLALWSESSNPHEIGGQAGNILEGTFFTPYADPFALKGQGGQFQTNAQFITRRLEIGGDSEVRMEPDPDRQTVLPIRTVRLIR